MLLTPGGGTTCQATCGRLNCGKTLPPSGFGMTRTRKTYFVSDLHIFSSRSQEHRYLEQIGQRAAHAGAFVLGGDIFDFRWSMAANPDETVARAIHWLHELAAEYPECQFHFVLGNHDYHEPFLDRLDHLRSRLGNFSWYPFYARLGGTVFLHGDVADRRTTAQKLSDRRSRWLNKKQRGPMANRLYDLAIENKLHKPMIHLARRRRTVARRILVYLEDIGEGLSTGVKNVYFGHTHLAFSDFEYRGVRFHNGGAPINGLRFRILEAVT
ncbi:MAG: metallophosphoesterase [Pirellulales bacterium]|nr:metallophosphoesterase [Pirellulales bacterium]